MYIVHCDPNRHHFHFAAVTTNRDRFLSIFGCRSFAWPMQFTCFTR